jgi:hypothetical protein
MGRRDILSRDEEEHSKTMRSRRDCRGWLPRGSNKENSLPRGLSRRAAVEIGQVV